jgi:outer membrane protein assembly factor BamB
MRAERSLSCAACGRSWRAPAARFCGTCGDPLPPPRSPVRVRRGLALPAGRATLAGLAMLAGLAGLAAVVGSPPGPTPRDRPTDAAVTLPAAGRTRVAPTEPVTDHRSACDGCERWQVDVDGALTSFAADGDDLVVGTSTGEVRSVDARTGTTRWSIRLGGDPARVTRTGPLVVAGTAGGRVVALAGEDGRVRWEVSIDAPTAGARAAAGDEDGVLLVSGAPPARTATAVDARTGETRWTRFLVGRFVGLGDTLVATVGRRLEGWSASAEEPRWSVPLQPDEELVGRAGDLVVTRGRGGPRFRDPVTGAAVGRPTESVTWWAAAADGTVLLADTADGTSVVALSPDGDERWRTDLPGEEDVQGCCVEVTPTPDGRVLAIDRRVDGRATVLDLATGTPLADVGRAAAAAPGLLLTGATGDLGVLQGQGAVVGVDLLTGVPRWRAPEASVVVSFDPLVLAGRRTLVAPATGDEPAGR